MIDDGLNVLNVPEIRYPSLYRDHRDLCMDSDRKVWDGLGRGTGAKDPLPTLKGAANAIHHTTDVKSDDDVMQFAQ